MLFEFISAARVIVGPGAVGGAGAIVAEFGRRALVVTGRSTERSDPLRRLLEQAGVAATFLSTHGEPTIAAITRAVELLRQSGRDVVVGFGGGSVIDSAKAIAALANNRGDVADYLEVIGRAQPLSEPSLPVVAIPTTAGTGSEVTRNAVLASPEHRVKVSLRHQSMYPRVAIVDPALTLELPPALSASTGLDALTQLIEPYVSAKANPLVDAMALEGIRRAARALPRVFRNGADLEARTDMALASLWSGMSLANAGLGAVHGLAGPIGGMFPAPHGAVCAALLPHVMAANLSALRRSGNTAVVARFAAVARALTSRTGATADEGIGWVTSLVADLAVPGLSTYGVTGADVPAIVQASQRASSMKANPVQLSAQELEDVVLMAL